MVQIRNPHAQTESKGLEFSDDKISAADKEELGYTTGNDGTFWMSIENFVRVFQGLWVGHVRDDATNNYILVENTEAGKTYTYRFNYKAGDNIEAGVEYINPRFFPIGCKTGNTMGILRATCGGKSIAAFWAVDWDNFNSFNFQPTEDGECVVTHYTNWNTYDLRQFSFRVLANREVDITNEFNTATSHKKLIYADWANQDSTTDDSTDEDSSTQEDSSSQEEESSHDDSSCSDDTCDDDSCDGHNCDVDDNTETDTTHQLIIDLTQESENYVNWWTYDLGKVYLYLKFGSATNYDADRIVYIVVVKKQETDFYFWVGQGAKQSIVTSNETPGVVAKWLSSGYWEIKGDPNSGAGDKSMEVALENSDYVTLSYSFGCCNC